MDPTPGGVLLRPVAPNAPGSRHSGKRAKQLQRLRSHKINLRKGFVGVFLLCCLAPVSCQQKAPASHMDRVLAKVDGTVILQRDLIHYYRSMIQVTPPEGGSPLPLALKQALLEKLIEEKLLLREATREGLKVSQQELDQLYEGTAKDYGKKFSTYLKRLGVTPATWKASLRRDLLIEKVIRNHLKGILPPTNEEIKLYYESHLKAFQVPMQYRFSQILVPTFKAAEQIVKKLKSGEDFAKLAKQYSISPEGKQGGDLGYWREDRLPEEFQTVRQMKIGDISGIIHSPYGYHILTLTGVRDARVLTLKEAGPLIASQLLQKKREAEEARWIKALKKQATIVLYEKALEKTTLH